MIAILLWPAYSAGQDAEAVSINGKTYMMKTYYMAFLKAGPIRDQDSIEAAKIQKAHAGNSSMVRGARIGASLILERIN